MAQNKQVSFGPILVPNAAGNLFNPPTLSGGVNPPADCTQGYFLFKKIRIVNRTAVIVNFSGFIGATGGSAANTEFIGSAIPVPANSYIEWVGLKKLLPADFFTGLASAINALTIEGDGEIGVA